jgi:hypothetical protein
MNVMTNEHVDCCLDYLDEDGEGSVVGEIHSKMVCSFILSHFGRVPSGPFNAHTYTYTYIQNNNNNELEIFF